MSIFKTNCIRPMRQDPFIPTTSIENNSSKPALLPPPTIHPMLISISPVSQNHIQFSYSVNIETLLNSFVSEVTNITMPIISLSALLNKTQL
jgi:hypothetical protein